jgi:hypothetical protein
VNRPSIWILGGIFLIVLGICIAGAVLAIASNDPDVEVNLGDDEFELEDVDGAAERIAEDGPDIFPDPTGGNRPIMVNHLGDDPETGWVAVLAIAPNTESCLVQWDADDEVFRDCEGETYPPDGEGLEQFPTRVEGDSLYVDLGRGPSNDPTTTTTTVLVTGDG